MKKSLRNRYFRWLLLLLVCTYALLAAVVVGMEWREAVVHGSPLRGEMLEVLAFLGVLSITFPVTIVIAWSIANRQFKPIHSMISTAERIRNGQLDERIPPLPGIDELARLGEAVNDAFDRYAAAVARLEHFSADAAHQLRTPMAVIQTSAEIALQQERTPDQYRDTLGLVLEQTDRLNAAVDHLLLLARLDRSLQLAFSSLDLDTLLQTWLREVAPMAEDRVVNYVAEERARAVRLAGDPVLLREAFVNIFDNAVAHTRVGGRIRLTLAGPVEGTLRVIVEDDGPGIPECERERVFERFVRGTGSAYPGSGLGLSVVREIARLHGGDASAGQSASLGGALLMLRLPVA
jgi:signal transduction histidine kinase